MDHSNMDHSNRDHSNMLAVVTAHPDDAELCAGGLLARDGGMIITVMAGLNGQRNAKIASSEQERAAFELGGVCGVETLNLGAGEFAKITEADVEWVDEIFEEYEIDMVISHHSGDTNQEHALASQLATAAARRLDNVLYFEPIPPSGRMSVPFRAQFYVDISDVTDKKYRAIECYQTQINRKGRNLAETRRALDRWRGTEIGVLAAECFEVVRWRG